MSQGYLHIEENDADGLKMFHMEENDADCSRRTQKVENYADMKYASYGGE